MQGWAKTIEAIMTFTLRSVYSKTDEELTNHEYKSVCRCEPVDLPWGGLNLRSPLREPVPLLNKSQGKSKISSNQYEKDSRALLKQVGARDASVNDPDVVQGVKAATRHNAALKRQVDRGYRRTPTSEAVKASRRTTAKKKAQDSRDVLKLVRAGTLDQDDPEVAR